MTRLALVVAVMLGAGAFGRADVVYQDDMWPPPAPDFEIFNNSEGTETEDNWVANSFQVVDGGTELDSITFLVGQDLIAQPVSAVIYFGVDLNDPSAGGGLVRIATTNVTLTASANTFVTIPLDTPVDLNVGDIFYAALLMPSIPGTLFPFSMDHAFTNPELSPPFIAQSFFDVGPSQGAPYDLDMTQNATVAGANHPVVGMAQDAGNFVIRVNAGAP